MNPASTPPARRELRWDGGTVWVTSPVPTGVWEEVAAADPTTMPFQTPAWRDCVVAGSGWQDASRLYELPNGRRLVLMMARRAAAPGLVLEASWPTGWGSGGVLAPGGVRPEETDLIRHDLGQGHAAGTAIRRGLAGGRAASTAIRPGFAAAPAWDNTTHDGFQVTRAVHVAHLTGASFQEFTEAATSRRTRSQLRGAMRRQAEAGVTITSGNTPALVDAFYQVYEEWIGYRAAQRKMPAPLAHWKGRRAEPYRKFATVAEGLGKDCVIWVAWWRGRPIGTAMSLYGGQSAIGWRAYTSRTAPSKFRLFEVLLHEELRHAFDSGCSYLEVGESVGREEVSAIKERMGAREHAFAEYCLERVPLTRGRIALQRLRRRVERRILAATHPGAGTATTRSPAATSRAAGPRVRPAPAPAVSGPRAPGEVR